MASVTSAVVTCSLKLETTSRKQPNSSLATEKSPEISSASTDPKLYLRSQNPRTSYRRNQTITQLNGNSEPLWSLDFREALSIIKEGSKIETTYYVPLLQECIDRDSLTNAKIIHAHIIKTGTHRNYFIMTFLVNVYAECGTVEEAQRVFDNLPIINVVAWTTLMPGYVKNSQPVIANNVLLDMLEGSAYPTNVTLGTAINACSSLNSMKLGKQIHAYIVKYQTEDVTSVGNSLCSLYSKCGSLGSAIKAFDRILLLNPIEGLNCRTQAATFRI